MEAARKGDGADGQRAKVVGSFTTEDVGKESMLQTLMQFVAASVTIRACGVVSTSFVRMSINRLCNFSLSTQV